MKSFGIWCVLGLLTATSAVQSQRAINATEKSAAQTTVPTKADKEVRRGKLLATFGGCHDCHNPANALDLLAKMSEFVVPRLSRSTVDGDLASVILFGSVLVLALGGTVSIDAKRRRNFGEQWAQFARVTSAIPFAAIAAGRNRLGPALVEIGVWRPLAAIGVYGVAFYLHGRLGPPLT